MILGVMGGYDLEQGACQQLSGGRGHRVLQLREHPLPLLLKGSGRRASPCCGAFCQLLAAGGAPDTKQLVVVVQDLPFKHYNQDEDALCRKRCSATTQEGGEGGKGCTEDAGLAVSMRLTLLSRWRRCPSLQRGRCQ